MLNKNKCMRNKPMKESQSFTTFPSLSTRHSLRNHQIDRKIN